jgi:hypothetical protein
LTYLAAMTFTDIQLFEIEKFFNEITIPEVVKIDAATTYTNAPLFVQENITLLKTKQLIPVIATQRWNMLCEVKKAILDPVK